MALLGKLEANVEISASANKFHEMFKSKPHQVTHATAHNIQGCDLHEGEWGTTGSIIFWNYVLEGKPCVAKELISIDEEKNSVTMNIIEGDLLVDYKTFVATVQATPKEGGGCIVNWTLEYEKRHETIPDAHSVLELCINISKDLDKYLINQA